MSFSGVATSRYAEASQKTPDCSQDIGRATKHYYSHSRL